MITLTSSEARLPTVPAESHSVALGSKRARSLTVPAEIHSVALGSKRARSLTVPAEIHSVALGKKRTTKRVLATSRLRSSYTPTAPQTARLRFHLQHLEHGYRLDSWSL